VSQFQIKSLAKAQKRDDFPLKIYRVGVARNIQTDTLSPCKEETQKMGKMDNGDMTDT